MQIISLIPPKDQTPVYYIERSSGDTKIEKIAAEVWLRWLYQNPVGKLTVSELSRRKMYFEIYGKLMNKKKSISKIQPFIDMFQINMQEYNRSKPEEFQSFNDFFTRKIKKSARPIDVSANSIISPADGKILVFEDISRNQVFVIKGDNLSLGQLLRDNKLAEKYYGGSMAIIRLCPADYHRFHFPASGIPTKSKKIRGRYFSVSPIALRENLKVFYQNKREYTILNTENGKNILLMEIGATFVGSIIQTYTPFEPVEKGEEKGYFKFGGSTVLLLFEKNSVVFDQDLIENTHKKLETSIKVGEHIAVLKEL